MASPASAPSPASFRVSPWPVLPLDHQSLLPGQVSLPTANALPPAKLLPAPPLLPRRERHVAPPPPPFESYKTPPTGRNPPPASPPPLDSPYPSPMDGPRATIPKAPGPPPMLINGTTSSDQGSSSPSQSQSNSSSLNDITIGLIIGISIALAGILFLIVPLIVCFCYRRKQKRDCHDFECPPPKDICYAALSQHVIKKIPKPGVNAIQVPAKHLLLQREVSSGTSANSDCESHFSPHGFGNVFGFSSGNFTYEELVLATGDFSEANLLGEGGFGYVHKGILPTGRVVAVKQLKMGSRQGEREFQAEVETITRVHHRHLVSLVGYCITGVKRLLVYEFVPNKTLEFHLHGTREPVMNWATRLKIALGSAKGLAYLHEDCNPTIIHRDIKAANILLDSKFDAKVADFGLAKFFSDANHFVSHVSTRVVGTFGYLAPEYAQSGKASDKSDVFSYGVVLLELITGRPPILEPETSMSESLVTWARPLLSQALEDGDFAALVDPHLEGNYDKEELANMVACAAVCVRHSTRRRPRMSQIIRALEGDIYLEDLDEGIRPGQSTVYNFDYGSGNFLRDISKLRMAFASQDNGYKSSGSSSSEDDPHPSDSSSYVKRPLQR